MWFGVRLSPTLALPSRSPKRPTSCSWTADRMDAPLAQRQESAWQDLSRHSYRRGLARPRQHIVSVLRDTPLPALMQVKRSLLARCSAWVSVAVRSCCLATNRTPCATGLR